jgi:two-component system LytT family sensor kinase
MRKITEVGVHIAFWVFVIALRFPTFMKVGEPSYFIGVLTISMFLHIIIFYLFYFYLGQIFKRGKFVWFVVCFIPFIFIWSIPATWVFVKLFNIAMNLGFIKEDKEVVPMYVTYISVVTSQALYAIFGTMFRFSINWFKTQKYEEELEKQNIANELALLRSQINPHFLFNTLNNIHAFVYRDQDKTAFGIIKLSEIMRYMLYDSNSEKVMLEKEITYINNYIDIQKLRVKEPDYIQFTVEGSVTGKQIPPLLLITFIENAFKHGKKNAISPGIVITLKTENNSLLFRVMNYIAPANSASDEYKGFGLKNLRRRLDLLYQGKYRLTTQTIEEQYIVELLIESL